MRRIGENFGGVWIACWSCRESDLPSCILCVLLVADESGDEPCGTGGEVFGCRSAKRPHDGLEAAVQIVDGLHVESLMTRGPLLG